MTEQTVNQLLKFHLNEDFVYDFFKNYKLDEEILEKYVGYFDPLYRFEKIVLEEEPENWWIEFVENEFGIKKLWYMISRFQELSEGFIERHSKKVEWVEISINQNLSESFIERHSDKMNWNMISQYQKLSEDFIERHADEVDWYYIAKY